MFGLVVMGVLGLGVVMERLGLRVLGRMMVWLGERCGKCLRSLWWVNLLM